MVWPGVRRVTQYTGSSGFISIALTLHKRICISDERTHPLWERPGRTDVEHLGHVLRVPLLGHVAQLCRDVDPPTDVHVHLPGFLLDLSVQV